MDGTTLEAVLRRDPHVAPYFEGVFAADTLPRGSRHRPSFYVVNSDPIRKPGQHWLALSIGCNGVGEYFDSYGLPPFVKEHKQFLNRHCKSWTWNTTELQAIDSTVCGQYCVMYLLFKAHGYTVHDFVKINFTRDCNKNDDIVNRMFERYMKDVKLCDDVPIKNKTQTCCKRRK